MRRLWAVFLREVAERRQILALGLFLGLLCPVLAALPIHSTSARDVREGLMVGLALIFFWLMSLLVGLGLFASEQASGRVGFFLALPLRPWQLLAGRVSAAMLVILLGTVFVALPSWLIDWLLSDGAPGGLGGAESKLSPGMGVAAVLLVFALSHALAVALRLRGRWTLFDIASLVAVAVVSVWIVDRAAKALILGAQTALPLVLAVAAVVAWLLGVWRQLRRGGGLRGRLHRAFSLTFWPVVLAAALLFAFGLQRALDIDWDDVTSFQRVVPSGDGSAVWLLAVEDLPRPLHFLFDLERGRRIPVDAEEWEFLEAPFLEGRTVLWARCALRRLMDEGRRYEEVCTLRMLDLAAHEPRVRDVPLDEPVPWDRPRSLLLGPDGRRLAVGRPGRVTVYELPRAGSPSARRLFETKVEGAAPSPLRFLPDGSVLLIPYSERSGAGSLVWARPDGSTRAVTVEGRIWALDAASGLFLEVHAGTRWLLDSEGRRLREVPTSVFAPGQARRLAGAAVVWVPYESQEFHTFDAEGRSLEPVPLPRPDPPRRAHSGGAARVARPATTYFGPEPEPGRILVTTGWDPRRWRHHFAGSDALGVLRRLVGLGPRHLRAISEFDRWTTHYVDLRTRQIVASFDGFEVVQKRLDVAGRPEAWLLDERGLPHRFEPERLDPQNAEASLVPVFSPPWGEEP